MQLSQKDRRAYINKKKSFIETSTAYDQGRVNICEYGATLGWHTYWPTVKHGKNKMVRMTIINVGPVTVGPNRCHGGVAPDSRRIYLGRDGRLWVIPGRKFVADTSNPAGLDRYGMQAWADLYARAIVESMTTRQELQAIDSGVRRYRAIVKAMVNERIAEAAAYGMSRSSQTYANGIAESWSVHDLISPRSPSMRHALMVSLVLGLEASRAAELIELAALLEFKAPMVGREAATAIHQKSVQLLMSWCPAWAHQSYLMDWRQHGSIDRYLRQHYLQLLRAAVERDIGLGKAAGI